MNLQEVIVEYNKNKTRDLCDEGETCCDISNIVREEYCPAGQKCTSQSFCTAERIGLLGLVEAYKKNRTVEVTEKPNRCPNNKVCCDISNIALDEYCPAGQKCTSQSACTSERIGLLGLVEAYKKNNTVVVTEKPSNCPNDEVCCDIEVETLPLKCGFRNINGIGSESKQIIGDAEFGKFSSIEFIAI